ncbi:TPM domain-containing protein [Bulleidia sp. zg-1006]|uniref:TPM domain-containing protein n=1 Tax=Bulleidia sp. zg-1006 TaxID=2806552 RepID=UPI00193A88B2|nr:TPM domain-containing protein [Bulleidia sp. zg-1006]QRG86589.1 TPM domain-containing protein [Bulleidia sp. zg-1006]
MRKKITFFFFALLLFLCLIPVQANENTPHVVDKYGLLSQEQIHQLEERAQKIEQEHKIAVYIRVYLDKGSYSTIESFSEAIYKNEKLGYGANHDGIMLVLTMWDRRFDVVTYGKKASSIYTAKKREKIASVVVKKYLRHNKYYEGFQRFMKETVDVIIIPFYIRSAIVIFVPLLLAGIYVFRLKKRHHSADIQLEASDYTKKGLQLSQQSDVFLYTTTVVIHKPKDDSDNDNFDGGGFSSSESGGFGHTSGSF